MQYLAGPAATLKGRGYALQQNLEKTKKAKSKNCSEKVWSEAHALSVWLYLIFFVS
jgi:predicted RNA-binding protein YlxR (DUF448 family)